jgi:putative RecB family exonuclease
MTAPVALELAPRLSPSRASDFKTCPQRFKFKVIDRLIEPPTIYTARGTLIHAALEELFTLPPSRRTLSSALGIFEERRARAREQGDLEGVFATAEAESVWALECHRVIENYFHIEDPAQLEPAGREVRLEAVLPNTLATVTGILDRVDRRHDGAFVITDYKTGSPPALQYANKNFFGLVIYAWLFRQTFGVVPARLRLLFLDAPEIYSLDPDERKIDAMAAQLAALWKGVEVAHLRQDWRPRPGPLCPYCSFRDACPAWSDAPS